ncbi:uncharacterized protein LOC115887665 [Sitophilus oryzae]|uniref:Uncharacterized protein LOC115887665 n=1 Tax=Sitophilus oryzae TaxID=7048 RepID=A0A6J2YJE3_SITOR|nr:uncharacterized protein LOC115887665 [Sitophilus oryzae]
MENGIIRRLVKLYGCHRSLWDPKHCDYYNKSRREAVWNEISRNTNVPAKELKRKMTSLLGSYRREKSREKKSRINGLGVYKSKWFAWPWFHFLSERNDIQDDISDDITDTLDNERTSSVSAPQYEGDIQSPRSSSPMSSNQYNEVQLSKKMKVEIDEEYLDELETPMEDLPSYVQTKNDEFEAFGGSIAAQLRALPLVDAVELQMEIQQLISKKRLSRLIPQTNDL